MRVSGPGARDIAQGVLGRIPEARRACFGEFRGEDGEILDEGLALFFPAPASFTGEDVLELQGHGGPVVMALLLARCLALGARAAEPGEFTRRAFLNDKLDLAQAESIADLIDAATTTAARSAVRSLRGAFSQEIHRLSDTLIDLRVFVEAALDFPEEEIDFLRSSQIRDKLEQAKHGLTSVLASARQGKLLREGLHVVLVGRPNVGKSSLLNYLAREEVAIVTDVAGTTRDALRQHLQLHGIPLHVVDTAGLRETTDPVERIGIERTWKAVESADMALLIVDAREGVTEDDRAILARLPERLPVLTVHNKADLLKAPAHWDEQTNDITLSVKTGEGMALLETALLRQAGWLSNDEGVFMARERHLQALRTAADHLAEAGRQLGAPELLAEELTQAQRALGSITGEFTPDDLLGEIFSRFCIGK